VTCRAGFNPVLRAGLRPTIAVLIVTIFGIPGCVLWKHPIGSTASSHRLTQSVRHSTRTANVSALAGQSSSNGNEDPISSNLAKGGTTGIASELTVNGDVIKAAEILKPIRQELAEKAGTLSPDAYGKYVRQLVTQLTREKITELLLRQRASVRLGERDEKALDAIVDNRMRRQVTQLGGGVQWQYESLLAKRGTTLEKERQRIRNQLVIQRYLQLNILPKVQTPTRDELYALFDKTKGEVARPERRRMSLIEINILKRLKQGNDQPTRQQLADARDKAMQTAHEAQNTLAEGPLAEGPLAEGSLAEGSLAEGSRPLAEGSITEGPQADNPQADSPKQFFAKVARQYSDGIQASNGGDWGWVSQGSLRKRWEPAIEMLYKLKPKTFSDIVETQDAIFIVYCDEIQQRVVPDFVKMQPQLTERFRAEQYNKMINKLIDELYEKARIEPGTIERFLNAIVKQAPRPKD